MKIILYSAVRGMLFIVYFAGFYLFRRALRSLIGEQGELLLGVITLSGFAGYLIWAWLHWRKAKSVNKEHHD